MGIHGQIPEPTASVTRWVTSAVVYCHITISNALQMEIERTSEVTFEGCAQGHHRLPQSRLIVVRLVGTNNNVQKSN